MDLGKPQFPETNKAKETRARQALGLQFAKAPLVDLRELGEKMSSLLQKASHA
jgi:hypothetical protein